ncbi:uncharacterized protein LOC114524491 isoform X2 [Dendronephthya gigantea]|uniref:uncharacterized protein LOC114524491 isoform X2 n=1 Tax=Dendronephthya gigantea TaxID=151771 RepID=UPI001069CD4D|nr:uncharacterized protein LOC114524491 isoform X2 [Dendronephthya gigantea]
MGLSASIGIALFFAIFVVVQSEISDPGYVLMSAKIKRCLVPDSSQPIEGSKVIHTSQCKDSFAFFKFLDTGAIQHVQSGLCIHLSGNNWSPKNREKAILKRDCSSPKFFFTYTGKSFRIKNKCLRPSRFRHADNAELITYSGCDTLESTYKFIDIIKDCDLICLKDIVNGKETTNSFDEFYKRSEAEVNSLDSLSSKFISTLKQEIPELYKDILSTFFPVDLKVIKNLKILVNHFGIEKMKAYPSLFLATAFIRRTMGVDTSNPAVCGGTVHTIAGVPTVDEEDAKYKLSLSESELASLLDEENYRAQRAIDMEREEDERAGINTTEFHVSAVQKLIDRLDGKYYHKFWTPASLKNAMKDCGFTDPSEVKFPPRGDGMSGIEYLEYLFSRDSALLPKKNLNFPWPLAIALNIQTSLRQCNWIWRRLENGERIVRYSRYTFDYNLKNVKCKPSDWNICTIPRIIEDGGVCGRQSTLARVTNHCLGIASGAIKQPAHAAGYTYTKSGEGYRFKIFQGITNIMNTYAVWHLSDDARESGWKINAEYHQGLTRAMNHGYKSYRDGRIALLIFSRIYDAKLRRNSRELLVEALEGNPHMMDVWMKLIHDVTKRNGLPVEGVNILKRIPSKCPQGLDESFRSRLIVLVEKHLSSYMQMYLEVLLRLLAPPSCCSIDKPMYLDILRSAWKNEKRSLVKEYLFDGYASCASKSASIPEFAGIVQHQVFSKIETKLPELNAFTGLLNSLSSLLIMKGDVEVEKSKSLLVDFFATVCEVFPRFRVTESAWVVAPHYRACVKAQLEFLKKYANDSYQVVLNNWILLQDKSAKKKETWNEYFIKDWLQGRTGDIIPLLVGVKESVDGGLIHEIKVNIAKNKPTSMSSTWKSQTSSKNAVDGKTDHLISGGSCAVTKTEDNPWFKLDLQKSTVVYGLLLSNTEDKQGNRLENFEIHIGDSDDQNGVTNPKCGKRHFVRRGETRAFYCDPPLAGQYITINIFGIKKLLPICEIAVYDSELTSYREHGVKMDVWRNVPTRDIQRLYDDQRYPNSPDEERRLSTFDIKNFGNYYGGRLSAVYQPLETGNYTFYSACNDECELFLRHGESEENLKKIISLTKATRYKVWNQSPDQKSTPIHLEEGKFYELVATIKQERHWNFLTVAVELPSGKFVAPIPAKRLFIDTKEESKVIA